MYDDNAMYPPPPPPPPPDWEPRRAARLGGFGKVVLAGSLLAGAGIGGFVIAQAARSTSPRNSRPCISRVPLRPVTDRGPTS